MAAELAVFYLSQSIDLSLKTGEKLRHAQAYEKALASLGLTPESRNKLKITVAQVDDAEAKNDRRAPKSKTAEEVSEANNKVLDLYKRHGAG